MVEKLQKSRRYRLYPHGYSICLVFLKLFERIYSPLTAGLLQPYRPDSKLQHHKRTQLDRASIKRFKTTSMRFFMLSASKLPEQREQNPRHHSHNGIKRILSLANWRRAPFSARAGVQPEAQHMHTRAGWESQASAW